MASPTVQLESIMISLPVDAHEERSAAAVDIVDSYLLEDIEEYVLVKLSGEVVNIMGNVNNRCIPFVVMKLIESAIHEVKKIIVWLHIICDVMVRYIQELLGRYGI